MKIVLPSVFNEIMSLVKGRLLAIRAESQITILASRTAANRRQPRSDVSSRGTIYLIVIGIVTLVAST